jgi:hypothetical protein
MNPTKAWAIVDEITKEIITVANMPRTFLEYRAAADEAWKYRRGKVVHVQILELDDSEGGTK